MTRMIALALLASCLATAPNAASAEESQKITPRVFLSVDKLPAGGTCDVAILLEVEDGWHVYANPASEDWQIPTSLSITSKHGTMLTQTLYPAGHQLVTNGASIQSYEGRVLLFGTIKIPAAAAGQMEDLSFDVRYQPCNDVQCLAPMTVKKPGQISVSAVGETVNAVNPKIFALKQAIAETGSVIR